MADKGRPLPKFGEWDVNDPASAEGFTVIFNKARNEKKTGGKPESPSKDDPTFKHEAVLGKPQSVTLLMFETALICRRNGFAACVRNHEEKTGAVFKAMIGPAGISLL
ncbi:hypothetical protein F8388_021851 [Cannabis sativa]|uniref:RIN4 pathogenic type III effector avirulence factor Avr cleavage site domain-containing protein n=1 Tax=Cannabis sativa TaxID=3483 RepID=A0A7J6ENI8_CANSA|nr:hypothetical protein F8388_021851 [Cannabis sativa]KAF4396460.1 hypothetical protein G4B88_019260 [Cannabis sativa]